MTDALSLDLSGAAEGGGFDAIPAGTYDAHVFEASIKGTKGSPGAVLPKDTPYINMQFVIDDSENHTFGNRRVFATRIIAPAKVVDPDTGKNVPYENKATMDRMLVDTLVALGNDEEEVKSKGFKLDLNEHVQGRPCRVKVAVEKQTQGANAGNDVNVVKAILKPKSANSADTSLLS